MVAPLVVAGGGLAVRAGLPALMAGARTLAARVLGSSAATGAAGAVARRTGIRGGVTKVIEGMKNNKLMTALVLMELGTEGSELLSQMAAEDEAVAEMISRYGVVNDAVPEDAGKNLVDQVDEMACITDAANAVGGLKNLHILRRALGLSEDHYKFYDHLKTVAQVVR